MITIINGNLAYSKGYALLLSEGRAINLPVEVLALKRMKNPPVNEILALLNTYYHGFNETNKKQGWIDPANRLNENGEYCAEIKNAFLSAEIPYVPLAITKLEIELCETKRKNRPEIINRLIAEWSKHLNGT